MSMDDLECDWGSEMTTKGKLLVALVFTGCIALIAIAPTGLIEHALKFADWWRDDSYAWGFRISVIAFSVSVISMMLTVWFAWMDRKMYAMFDKTIADLQEQRRLIESLDANLGRIISICAENRAVLSNVEATVDALSEASSASDDMNKKTTQSHAKSEDLNRRRESSEK
jgi:Na+/melibiose symporter-like transporter